MEPVVEVLGAYRVEADIDRAFEIKYGDRGLQGEELRACRAEIEDELSRLVLIELLVRHRDERFDLGDFHQPGSEQAPYDEAYLSPDGTEVLSRSQPPDSEPLRVVFFLHFFEPATPLETSYGRVSVPQPTSVPNRLQDLIPYEPAY